MNKNRNCHPASFHSQKSKLKRKGRYGITYCQEANKNPGQHCLYYDAVTTGHKSAQGGPKVRDGAGEEPWRFGVELSQPGDSTKSKI